MVYNISSKWHKPSEASGVSSNQWQEFRVVYWTREKTKERYPSILIPRERKFACLTCFHTFPTLDEVAGHAEIHLRTRRGYVDNSQRYFGENSKLIPKVKIEDEDEGEEEEGDNNVKMVESSDEYSEDEDHFRDQLEFTSNLNEQTKRVNRLLKLESEMDPTDSLSESASDLESISQSKSGSDAEAEAEAEAEVRRNKIYVSNTEVVQSDNTSSENEGSTCDSNTSKPNTNNSSQNDNTGNSASGKMASGANFESFNTPETTSNLSTKLAKLISSKKVNPLLQAPLKRNNIIKQKLTLPETSQKATKTETVLKPSIKAKRTAPVTTTISPMSTSGIEDNSSPSLFVNSDEATDSSSSDEFVSADESFSDAEGASKQKKKRRRRVTKSEKRKLALLEQHPELDSQFIAYSEIKKPKVSQMSLEKALSQAAQLGNRRPLPSWQKKYLSEKPNVEMEKLVDLQEVIANKSVDFEERIKEDKRRLPKKINEKLSNDIPNQFLQFLQPPSA